MGKVRRASQQVMPAKETAGETEKKPKAFIVLIPFIILGIIILVGTYYRAYHLSYPVIGYHNWKETHYLSEARNFAEHGFFTHGFFVPYSDLPFLKADPAGAHPDTFPTISIVVGIFFKIFGPSLAVARIINLLFGLGAIVFMYLVVKKLFKREDLALAAAFVSAILPVYVYFSHNVQLDNAGVFLMLVTVYVYLLWIEKNTTAYAILTSIFLTATLLTKYSFAIIVIPMLFIFPYSRLKEIPKKWKLYLLCIIILLFIPFWMWYSNVYLEKQLNAKIEGSLIYYNLGTAFSGETWVTLKNYAVENYGGYGNFPFGILIAGLGILLFIFMLTRKDALKKQQNRFLLGYIIAVIPWFLVMSEKLIGHSYHQYPLVPLIALLIAYFFVILAVNVEMIFKKRFVRYILLIIFIPLLLIPCVKSMDRLFNVQFYGLDVAGDYIREHSAIDETIFHSTNQNYGVLWNANRKGYRPPANVEDLKWGEDNRNVKWIFMYQWGISTYMSNQDLANYIAQNYRLRQVGLMQGQGGYQPIYFLFSKGGSTNFSDINSYLKDKPLQTRTYENTEGKITFNYINVE
jgi:4-amino-4-deoxy-L-arabinose transferase-like glycosyltransferase